MQDYLKSLVGRAEIIKFTQVNNHTVAYVQSNGRKTNATIKLWCKNT